MSKPVATEIVADISLLPTEQGGKKLPILGEYRGVLGITDKHFSFRLQVPAGAKLAPGASGRFGIEFLSPEEALPLFPVGASFTLWEGRTVGHGCVIEVQRHA